MTLRLRWFLSLGLLACLSARLSAEDLVFDLVPAVFPQPSSVNVVLTGPPLIGTATDSSSLSGQALIDLRRTSPPFGAANLADLTLVLDDGIDLALAGGLVTATAAPGLTRISMVDPGFSTPIVNGMFNQESAMFEFEGEIDLSTQEEPFDLATVTPIIVDLNDIRIFEQGSSIVSEMIVDLEFSASIATDFFGQVPLSIRIQGGAQAVHHRLGDVNEDTRLDVNDIDTLAAAIRANRQDSVYDLDGNGTIDATDLKTLVEVTFGTYFGDSDLNGEFNSSDLVNVFQAGEYEDHNTGNSTWSTGDWNGDAEFDSGDVVFAFQGGGYERGPRPTTNAVPEPNSIWSLLCGLALTIKRRRHRRSSLPSSSRVKATWFSAAAPT